MNIFHQNKASRELDLVACPPLSAASGAGRRANFPHDREQAKLIPDERFIHIIQSCEQLLKYGI